MPATARPCCSYASDRGHADVVKLLDRARRGRPRQGHVLQRHAAHLGGVARHGPQAAARRSRPPAAGQRRIPTPRRWPTRSKPRRGPASRRWPPCSSVPARSRSRRRNRWRDTRRSPLGWLLAGAGRVGAELAVVSRPGRVRRRRRRADGRDVERRRPARTCSENAGRRASPCRARSSGAIACSSRPPSAAIASAGIRTGLYGDVEPVDGRLAARLAAASRLDKRSGKVLWDRVAHKGIPKTKRHPKSSQASATPVTDGRHVIVSFGSEGLYGYRRRRQAALEARPRRPERRLVLRPRLRMGHRAARRSSGRTW